MLPKTLGTTRMGQELRVVTVVSGLTRELLIRILSEWVIAHTPGNYDYEAEDALFTISDFMAVTNTLFKLKGIQGETITIGGDKP